MTVKAINVAIVGAGPYGLSLAAHLKQSGINLRIFGTPMHFWSHHMPHGMCLKSEGFASNLHDSETNFTLKSYCIEKDIPYADIGLPVRLETFVAYALEFQRRYVPQVEDVQVTSLTPCSVGFELELETGEPVHARHVVIAAGIMRFAHIPPPLADLPGDVVTHSSEHNDLSGFKGRRVAVVGAGASAVDIAGLLHQNGAEVDLIARRRQLEFPSAPVEPRPLIERLRAPRSGLGIGWRSRMCTDIPLVFHAMPRSLRLRAVQRHLGPAPCWFVHDMVAGRLPIHLGAMLVGAHTSRDRVHLVFSQGDQKKTEINVDHVIAATGYTVELSRLEFIDSTIQARIAKVADTPILDRNFQSSVPGLYFIGAAAANSFGPLLRFAYGANFAAKRLTKRLLRDRS